jgi:hypothetical protein
MRDGFVVLKKYEPTTSDEQNIIVNDQVLNVLYDALDINEFNRIKTLATAHEIWTKFMEIHEGTTIVRSVKLYVYKGNFEQFIMKEDENISDMFNRFNEIVNELKGLGLDVPDVDFSHKFLRSLPEKYDIIVTMLVRSDLAKKVKNDSIAFKDDASKIIEKEKSEDEESESESDQEMTLFVKRFNKFMKKGQSRRGQSSRRSAFNDRK